jgi:ABC-2 type transport system ATP-binding protein
MIFDEPTNGLDPAGIKEVRDLLKRLAHTEGISVFVSSHILKEMQEMCDTVCIINNGRILRTGSVDELTHDAARGLYRYRLRQMDKAVELLRENAADRISEIGEDYVDLHVSEDEIEILNRRLVENGITIYGMSPVETSLEQIFMEITGGGNIVD